MKKIVTEFPYQVKVIENEWFTLSDGTRLSYRIWLPESEEPLPTILEYLPYRKTDGTRGRDNPMHGFSRVMATTLFGWICGERESQMACWKTSI